MMFANNRPKLFVMVNNCVEVVFVEVKLTTITLLFYKLSKKSKTFSFSTSLCRVVGVKVQPVFKV